ncbi:MAG: PAS domain-containing protein, partial [Planctomycetes bacterium]|nr:PAS domain-containing protein [Planctomycetota bacterium]
EMVVLHELEFNDQNEAINYRITDCNNAFTAVTGIKADDALGKLATDVYQDKTAPHLEEYSRVALRGEPYEFTIYNPPLDKHFMISVVSPRKNHFATITTDITPIKRIQEVVSAKNRELENYLYVASHDLRSPLVNIQGFSQRLQKQTDSIKKALAQYPQAMALAEVLEVADPAQRDFVEAALWPLRGAILTSDGVLHPYRDYTVLPKTELLHNV